VARERVLGVLGGMGPAATADFYTKLVKATPALQDQDHIPVVVVGDPRIADRSRALESGTESVVLAGMLRSLHHLERVGVDAIAIPCNTAHCWLRDLTSATDIPFISLIEASVREARTAHPGASTALILGTRATVSSRLYDSELRRVGFGIVPVTDEQQDAVDAVISNVKAGTFAAAESLFESLAKSCWNQADVVLLACTELPLAAAAAAQFQPKIVDTTAALVNACIAWAKQ
jgi:aspartate racemase